MKLTPLRVESEYDYGQYRTFFIFNFFRGKNYQLNILLDFLGMPLLYAVIKGFAYLRTRSLTFGLFDLLYLAFYLLLLLYVLFAPRLYYNQTRATADVHIAMEFDEESFSITYEGSISSGENVFLYNAIYRVYELPQAFYIYISSSQAYLLQKERLSPREVEQLRILFTQKMGDNRYIRCRTFGAKAPAT